MKHILSITISTIILLILFYPSPSNSNTSGSVGGKTGSPTDGASCSQCHYAGTGIGATITSNIPVSGYIPGNLYTITININDPASNKFGFEITSEETNFGSAKKGTFFVTNSTETKLINNNTAITHKVAGVNGINNSKTWSFDWEAPGFSSSTGSITFYAALISANGDGQNTGDTYHTAPLVINESSTNITDNLSNKNNINFNSITKEIELVENQKAYI